MQNSEPLHQMLILSWFPQTNVVHTSRK